MWEIVAAQLAKSFIPLLSVVGVLVSAALYQGVMYIRKKTNNEAVENALTRISRTVRTVVDGLSQTMAAELRALSEDGKLTKEDAASLKNLAVEAVKNQIPYAIQQIVAGGVVSLDSFISDKIEQAVLDQKGFLPIYSGIDWADKP